MTIQNAPRSLGVNYDSLPLELTNAVVAHLDFTMLFRIRSTSKSIYENVNLIAKDKLEKKSMTLLNTGVNPAKQLADYLSGEAIKVMKRLSELRYAALPNTLPVDPNEDTKLQSLLLEGAILPAPKVDHFGTGSICVKCGYLSWAITEKCSPETLAVFVETQPYIYKVKLTDISYASDATILKIADKASLISRGVINLAMEKKCSLQLIDKLIAKCPHIYNEERTCTVM